MVELVGVCSSCPSAVYFFFLLRIGITCLHCLHPVVIWTSPRLATTSSTTRNSTLLHGTPETFQGISRNQSYFVFILDGIVSALFLSLHSP